MKDSKSCFASGVRWIVTGLDKIIHHFNYYAYTQVCASFCVPAALRPLGAHRPFWVRACEQIGIYHKPYCVAANDTWRLLSARGSINILNDNVIGALMHHTSRPPRSLRSL